LTDAPNGGFTSGTPWLRLAPHHERNKPRTQRADPGSVLHRYRRLIALRKALPVLVRGDVEVEQLAEAHARPDDGSQAARPTVAPATPRAGRAARVCHRAGGRR